MTHRKVIIIGFDGLDPKILEDLLSRAELPHFARLARTGCFRPLETVDPPQSPVVWTTIATGDTPAGHGVYDFLTRDPGEYRPQLSIMRQGKLGYVRPYTRRTFWELAAEKGIPATMIKWPLTFPATPMSGALLSGLGTPDIRGTLGRYTFFTSRDLPEPEGKKGAIVRLDGSQGTITTRIAGPLKLSFHGPTEVLETLEMELGEARIFCRLGGISFTLEEGRWSDWIRLVFKVGFLRTVGGMVRFYLESVKPDFNLYMTPINFDNDTKSPPLSYPLGYGQQLSHGVGPYGTLGLAEDTNALNDGLISEKGFLAGCDLIQAEREKIFSHELTRFHRGILGVVFDTTDRIHHMLWRYLDQDHPLHDASGAAEYTAVLTHYYQRMDGILGRALAAGDGDTLIIACSDHGFTSFRRAVHLNTWLVQQGFMVLQEGRTVGREQFADVDWSRTTAFALGLNSLFLNIKERDRQGSLDPSRVEAVKAELVRRLEALTDHGKPVVKKIHDPGELYGQKANGQAPDLLVGYDAGYRASWQTALGEAPDSHVIVDNLGKWSGDHCCDSQIVPGIFLTNRGDLTKKPHVQDICPLILDYLS